MIREHLDRLDRSDAAWRQRQPGVRVIEPRDAAAAVARGTRRTVANLPRPSPTDWLLVALAYLGLWAALGAAVAALVEMLR